MSGKTPGQAAYEAYCQALAEEYRADTADWPEWEAMPEAGRKAWEAAAAAGAAPVQDSAVDSLRAFAQDEILANAGTEWDRPLGPEQNAIEYVRHLEHERDQLAAEILKLRDDLATARTALRNIALGLARDPSVAADQALVAIRDAAPVTAGTGHVARQLLDPGNPDAWQRVADMPAEGR